MYKIGFLFFLSIFLAFSAKCQLNPIDTLRNNFDKSYGLDVFLNNGRKFYPDTKPVVGNPYWNNENWMTGNVTISGKTYNNQKLKYDICKQEFLLSYTNFNGQEGQIILNGQVIDSVRIGQNTFVKSKTPQINQKFVEKIYEGKLSCFIGWHKELKFNTTGVNTGYEYTKDLKMYYVIYKGITYRFSNKASFLNIYSAMDKSIIKKYLSKNRIRFKKLEEPTLKNLIIYCAKSVQ